MPIVIVYLAFNHHYIDDFKSQTIFRKVIEEDINIDGKKEFLDLELYLTTNETLDVHSITLLLIFDFKIQVNINVVLPHVVLQFILLVCNVNLFSIGFVFT